MGACASQTLLIGLSSLNHLLSDRLFLFVECAALLFLGLTYFWSFILVSLLISSIMMGYRWQIDILSCHGFCLQKCLDTSGWRSISLRDPIIALVIGNIFNLAVNSAWIRRHKTTLCLDELFVSSITEIQLCRFASHHDLR